MPAPYLGGFRITKTQWVGATAIRVDFESTYGSTYAYQLYVGRTRVGATPDQLSRSIVGQLQPSEWPQVLQIVAVDPLERFTDYGALLPKRPYNRVRLRFSTTAWPADSRYVEVIGGTEPEGAPDEANLIDRQLFDTDREYLVTTPPLSGSGEWNFEARGRDGRPGGGNVGDPLSLSAEVLACPPDVALVDGRRLSVAVEDGDATISWSY